MGRDLSGSRIPRICPSHSPIPDDVPFQVASAIAFPSAPSQDRYPLIPVRQPPPPGFQGPRARGAKQCPRVYDSESSAGTTEKKLTPRAGHERHGPSAQNVYSRLREERETASEAFS